MAGKPLLYPEDRTEAERFDPKLSRGNLDPSRIPGYSEIVQANDIDKADDLYFREQNDGRTKEDVYRQIGAQPQKLQHEFRWLRITDPGGANSWSAAREIDRAKNQEGFRLARKEDLEPYGGQLPPTARLAEDGTIRRGPDVALYVRSGEVARRWEQFLADETARLEGSEPSAGRADLEVIEEQRSREDIAH